MATPLSTRLTKRLFPLFVAAIAAAAAITFIVARGGSSGATRTVGLPHTPDYHSLLVDLHDPSRLVLGTHNGLFRSTDGGRTWRRAQLEGKDAMNLARVGAPTIWAAGHHVLVRSTDGGATWADVRPRGLPGLDVHGFAVDPAHQRTVFAAIAGQGLYRSTDGGETFALRSRDVGPGVFAIAVLPGGRVLVGDLQQQALVESVDGGTTWRTLVHAGILGLGVDPGDGSRILAAGPGVLLSTDSGKTWRQTLRIDRGAGPIAWAPSDPRRAYVVGLDRVLYTTVDAGETWAAVRSGKAG